MLLIFVFWFFKFKVCNNACIMHSFGKKNHFHPFLLSVFKMNDTANFEDNFLYNLVVIKPGFSIQSL